MRKRSNNPAQLRLSFPPQLTGKLITCWRQLKTRYPDPLVFVVESGHYVTLDNDAVLIGLLTGQPLEAATAPFITVPIDQGSTWFGPLASEGLSILICDPPHDPSRFVFT